MMITEAAFPQLCRIAYEAMDQTPWSFYSDYKSGYHKQHHHVIYTVSKVWKQGPEVVQSDSQILPAVYSRVIVVNYLIRAGWTAQKVCAMFGINRTNGSHYKAQLNRALDGYNEPLLHAWNLFLKKVA